MNWTDTNLNHESNFHYFYHGIGFVAEEYEILGLWYLFEEHDYFSTRMHTRERADDALLWTMLIKSIHTVAALIDVNFQVITKNTCRLQNFN